MSHMSKGDGNTQIIRPNVTVYINTNVMLISKGSQVLFCHSASNLLDASPNFADSFISYRGCRPIRILMALQILFPL